MVTKKVRNFTLLFLAMITAFSLGFGLLRLFPKDNTPQAQAASTSYSGYSFSGDGSQSTYVPALGTHKWTFGKVSSRVDVNTYRDTGIDDNGITFYAPTGVDIYYSNNNNFFMKGGACIYIPVGKGYSGNISFTVNGGTNANRYLSLINDPTNASKRLYTTSGQMAFNFTSDDLIEVEGFPYAFLGFIHNGTNINEIKPNLFTLVLTQFTPAEYSLTYDANGGTGGAQSASGLEPGSSQVVGAAPAAPTGRIFTGWSDGTIVYNPNDNITMTSNITLTAQWQSIVITSTDLPSSITEVYVEGDSFADILPQTVKCYFSGGNVDLAVTWDLVGKTYGPHFNETISGTISQPSDSFYNIDSIKNVSVAVYLSADTITITSIETIEDIKVAKGSSTVDLPGRITCYDSTSKAYELNITWTGNVNTSIAGTYPIEGTIENKAGFDFGALSNKVDANVVVYTINIESVATLNAIDTDMGSTPSLPSTVIVNLSNGGTASIGVIWDSVDTSAAGPVSVLGTLSVVDPYTNNPVVKASIVVNVVAYNIVHIDDLTLSSTSLDLPDYPTTVEVELDDQRTVQLPVVWDLDGIDVTVPDIYEIFGTVTCSDPYTNTQDIKVKLTLTVKLSKIGTMVFDFKEMSVMDSITSAGTVYFSNTSIGTSSSIGANSLTQSKAKSVAVETTDPVKSTTNAGVWAVKFPGESEYASVLMTKGSNEITTTINLSVKTGAEITIFYSQSKNDAGSGTNMRSVSGVQAVSASGQASKTSFTAESAKTLGLGLSQELSGGDDYVAVIRDIAKGDGIASYTLGTDCRVGIYRVLIKQEGVEMTAFFNNGGGEGAIDSLVSDLNAQVTLPSGENLTAPSGYTFVGWTRNRSDILEAGRVVSLSSDTTFTAVYAKVELIGMAFRKVNPAIKFGFKINYLNMDEIKLSELSGKFTTQTDKEDPAVITEFNIAKFVNTSSSVYKGEIFDLTIVDFDPEYMNTKIVVVADVEINGVKVSVSSADYGEIVVSEIAKIAYDDGALTDEEAARYGVVIDDGDDEDSGDE